MKIKQSKVNYRDVAALESACYLLTNGLGGYSSMSLANSLTRNDHSFFMAAIDSVNHRYHVVRKLDEYLLIDGVRYDLSSQSYVNPTKNFDCFFAFQSYEQEYLPVFEYFIQGVTIRKTIVMEYQANTIGVQYEVYNPNQIEGSLYVEPKYLFANKGNERTDCKGFSWKQGKITNDDVTVYYFHNGSDQQKQVKHEEDLLFTYDVRDGRDAIGHQFHMHTLQYSLKETHSFVTFSLHSKVPNIEMMIAAEISRKKALIDQANVSSMLTKQLLLASDQFVVLRDTKDSASIVAGYPFFGDWGRDTMIAMLGCCIETNRWEEAKRMFRTFIRYEKQGVLPNLFPEHGVEPRYNTIDASLQFVVAIYKYYQKSGDFDFVKEAYPTIQNIITWYQQGTLHNIHMDERGFIAGGSDLDQLTWMDVCVNGYLPTPRQGFAVEINALWFNTLCIYIEFSEKMGINTEAMIELRNKVMYNFQISFVNEYGYLHDVLEDGTSNNQIRPNQLYAVGLPFKVLQEHQARSVIAVVEKELLTALGLRSLSMFDKAFKAVHTNSHWERDIAYHQGTVWTFLIGQYVDAIIYYYRDDSDKMEWLYAFMKQYENALYEGCIGQIAEIYDGAIPSQSRGCFAQAWSVSEVLRSIMQLEGELHEFRK